MIHTFVIIALFAIASADVSEIIKPSKEYLPPPSREYLPPALPKLIVSPSSIPTITTLYQQELQSPSTTPSVEQDILVQSTVAPETIKTTASDVSTKLDIEEELTSPISTTFAPSTIRVPVQREYLPPAPVSSVLNENLPPIPSIATPNGITITSNEDQDDLDILTNIISQPILSTITVPQISTIINSDLATTVTSQPSIVTFISETTPVSITSQPTSVPEYIQSTSSLPAEDNSQNDPLIRINASELSEALDQISELPDTSAGASTPETILSEDGYHYSIPLVSFGSLNKKR